MWSNLIVTGLISAFVAIVVLGHVLIITALLSKPNGARRAEAPNEPAESKDTQPAGRGLQRRAIS